ncbi:MAG: DUF305 domain-containing protein [Aeromicrobium erythreum]
MSDLALEPARGASADVTDLATRIRAAQKPEIEELTGFLEGWGEDVPSGHGDHGGHGGRRPLDDRDDERGPDGPARRLQRRDLPTGSGSR